MVKRISTDQSLKARVKRLAKGKCPVHGKALSQMSVRHPEWGYCNWNGKCKVRAIPNPPPGKTFQEITSAEWVWILLPKYQYLVEEKEK